MSFFLQCTQKSFADPDNALSTALNVDQTYFNVGWGGVRSRYAVYRHNFSLNSGFEFTPTYISSNTMTPHILLLYSSSLPYALEPDPTTGNLPYTDPNNVRNLPLCRWGNDEPGGLQGIVR